MPSSKATSNGGGGGGGGGTTCSSLTGSSWVPDVTGAGAGNRDGGVTITNETYTRTGIRVTALNQSFSAGAALAEVQFTIPVGFVGSIGLQAELTGLHSTLRNAGGYGWPALVELTAPTYGSGAKDWVNLTSTCKNTSLFTGGSYAYTAGCTVDVDTAGTPMSGFLGASDAQGLASWELSNAIGYAGEEYSHAVFPSCDWAAGAAECPFVANNFLNGSGELPAGTYTAKYIIVTNFLVSSLGAGHSYTGDLRVTVRKKAQAVDATIGKAVDLNVILVGNENINASRTARGQMNLDLLLEGMQSLYSAAPNNGTANLKIGTVTAYEWDCASGGDTYATLSVNDLATFFKTGSSLVSAASSGTALNVFLVSRISSGSGGGLTVLGVAGGIPGSLVHGTAASGLVFSTMDDLATFNSSCTPGGACALGSQDADFVDMQATVAHEVGHYLGLRHLSEKAGTTHDLVPDTPECSTTTGGMITQSSCRSAPEATCNAACPGYNGSTTFCAAAADCQFNHLMFWLSKNISSSNPANGDGNLITTDSGAVIRLNPHVR